MHSEVGSSVIVVTGVGGLIGSEAARHFLSCGHPVVGIDNDMRGRFFGSEGSVANVIHDLKKLPGFEFLDIDIVDFERLRTVFTRYQSNISCIIHCAAQPSHDWAASDPLLDFNVNALGTLNLLKLSLDCCPEASFIFCSTNKVYGDRPNDVFFVKDGLRFSPCPEKHPELAVGFNEQLAIDQSMHSLFGVSKLSADLLVQEFGRYFGMNTVCFRGGCLTGASQQGVKLHGFLNYLVKSCVLDGHYEVIGYEGYQVRDNIHASDLVSAFYEYFKSPRKAAVYNIGGGQYNSCSVLEALEIVSERASREIKLTFVSNSRKGDHKWWITDCSKFKRDYPTWELKYSLESTLTEIVRRYV